MLNNPLEIDQTDKLSLSLLKTVADSVTDMGIFVTDMDDRIVVYNKAASYFDRIEQHVAVGLKYTDLYKDKDGGSINKVKATGKPIIGITESFVYPDGRKQETIDDTYPVFEDGKMKYVLAFTHYDQKSQKSLEIINAAHNSLHENARYSFKDIIGESPAYKRAVLKAEKAAMNNAPVTIEGESGTGKELFAQSIHRASGRASKPFIAINCAAIPENLLESMLFGTKAGAFTGAKDNMGLLEEAGDGTFFFDELTSMPKILQGKILRVIQERRIRRIGAQRETPISCRFISSFNKPPLECVKDGELRADLYYRLTVVDIVLPPLRERKEDIPLYVDYFIKKFSGLYSRNENIAYTDDFLNVLMQYDWPGNVRELEHTIECAVALKDDINALDSSCINSNIRRAALSDIESETVPQDDITGRGPTSAVPIAGKTYNRVPAKNQTPLMKHQSDDEKENW